MAAQNQTRSTGDARNVVRPALNPERHHIEDAVTKEDVQRLLGDLDDVQLAHILAWSPTLADLDSVAVALAGDYDELPRNRDALSGKAAAIFEIVWRKEMNSSEAEIQGR